MAVQNSFESTLKKVGRKNNFLEIVEYKTHIVLPSGYLGKIKEGVSEQLHKVLLCYSKSLNGLPLAFNNKKVQLLSRVAKIVADQPCIHFDVQTELIVFKPDIGDVIQGRIHRKQLCQRDVAIGNFSCLVHDIVYAFGSYEKERYDPHVGDVVLLKVTDIQEDGFGFLGISGKLLSVVGNISSQGSSTEPFHDSGIDETYNKSLHTTSPTLFMPETEDAIESCNEANVVLDELQESLGMKDNEKKLKKSKKKKKKKSNQEVVFMESDRESISKQRKEEKEDVKIVVESDAEANGIKKTKKKKKKKKPKKEEIIIESDAEATGIKKTKKKKKQKPKEEEIIIESDKEETNSKTSEQSNDKIVIESDNEETGIKKTMQKSMLKPEEEIIVESDEEETFIKTSEQRNDKIVIEEATVIKETTKKMQKPEEEIVIESDKEGTELSTIAIPDNSMDDDSCDKEMALPNIVKESMCGYVHLSNQSYNEIPDQCQENKVEDENNKEEVDEEVVKESVSGFVHSSIENDDESSLKSWLNGVKTHDEVPDVIKESRSGFVHCEVENIVQTSPPVDSSDDIINNLLSFKKKSDAKHLVQKEERKRQKQEEKRKRKEEKVKRKEEKRKRIEEKLQRSIVKEEKLRKKNKKTEELLKAQPKMDLHKNDLPLRERSIEKIKVKNTLKESGFEHKEIINKNCELEVNTSSTSPPSFTNLIAHLCQRQVKIDNQRKRKLNDSQSPLILPDTALNKKRRKCNTTL